MERNAIDLQYPIGRPELPEKVERLHIEPWIADMAAAPERLRLAVAQLTEEQIDTPYRPGGWTVRQVVHHLPDSHMNAYVSFRLGLTEDRPVLKSANVDAWAQLPDCKIADIQMSLDLFAALQERWVTLLQSLTASDFDRMVGTEARGDRSLATLLGIYAWHGKHHVAHIMSLRDRMGW